MANSYFQFKQFTVHQDKCAMKVTTDGCLFGAWAAERLMRQKAAESRLLDVGTGTGLLALMLAQKNNNLNIDAIEVDNEAAQQAKENVLSTHWKNNINVINADAKNYHFTHKYDVIISNPPFYESELKGSDTKKNVAHHNDGLLLHELLLIIKNNLSSEGIFFLLIPFKRNQEITEMLLKNEFYISEMMLVRQSISHDFFRIMMSGSLNPDKRIETFFDEICIRNDKLQYTPEFNKLLRDYYLYL